MINVRITVRFPACSMNLLVDNCVIQLKMMKNRKSRSNDMRHTNSLKMSEINKKYAISERGFWV